jgi:hypothetical protein
MTMWLCKVGGGRLSDARTSRSWTAWNNAQTILSHHYLDDRAPEYS